MVIRSFFRKNNQQLKSKFNFVNSESNIEELAKIKNIIQKHLIAKK